MASTMTREQMSGVKYRLVTVRRGYPLASAGELTSSQFQDLPAALSALGPHKQAFGSAGTFNPRHPSATEYELVAVSTQDSSKAVVCSYEDSLKVQTLAAWLICSRASSGGNHHFVEIQTGATPAGEPVNGQLCRHCGLPQPRVERYAQRAQQKLQS